MKKILIKNQTERGFNLIETLLYIAMLVVIALAVINSLVTIVTSYKNVKAASDMETSATTAFDRMSREIRDATSIDNADSVFGSNPGVLEIFNGTSTLKFYVATSTLYLDKNGSTEGPLSLSGITVSNLIFTKITTSNSSAVKIQMTLQSVVGTVTKSMNFYDTVSLRGSY